MKTAHCTQLHMRDILIFILNGILARVETIGYPFRQWIGITMSASGQNPYWLNTPKLHVLTLRKMYVLTKPAKISYGTRSQVRNIIGLILIYRILTKTAMKNTSMNTIIPQNPAALTGNALLFPFQMQSTKFMYTLVLTGIIATEVKLLKLHLVRISTRIWRFRNYGWRKTTCCGTMWNAPRDIF